MAKVQPDDELTLERVAPKRLCEAPPGCWSYQDGINLVAAQNRHLTVAQVTRLLLPYIEPGEETADAAELLSFAFEVERFSQLALEYVRLFGNRPAMSRSLDRLCGILQTRADPGQSREQIVEETIRDLAADIKQRGLLTPPIAHREKEE